MRRLGGLRLLVAVTVTVAAVSAVTPAAFAHPVLVRAEPADGAVLARAPARLRLTFSEEISDRFRSVRVLDLKGRPVAVARLRRDPADRTRLSAVFPRLRKGTYSVNWKVLSETDGHLRGGAIVFGVGKGADLSAAVIDDSGNRLAPLEILLRWLNFGALAALVGSLAVASLVFQPAGVRAPLRRLSSLALLGGTAAVALGFGLLLWQTVELRDAHQTGGSFIGLLADLLVDTRWGLVWVLREGALLALLAVVLVLRREARTQAGDHLGSPLAAPVVILLVFAAVRLQAEISHAAALEVGASLAVLADAAHLLAAYVWVGGLLALGLALWPLRGTNRLSLPPVCRRRFTVLAATSASVLAVTGLYSLGREVASVDALLTTLYGRAMLVKAGLVAVVAVIALTNAAALHSGTHRRTGRLRRLLLAEVGVASLVLLAAGVLTSEAPPRGPAFAPVPHDAPSTLSRSVDDLLVTMSAKPSRPGQNVISVLAVSTRRPPPAEIEAVRVSFDPPEGGVRASALMQRVEAGRYRLGGSQLGVAGRWVLEVAVLRPGLEQSVATFDWPVAPLRPSRVVVSQRPLEPLLTPASGVGLALLALMALWFWLGRRPGSPGRRLWSRRLRQEAL